MDISTTQGSSNVDIVRGTYEASARGDLDAFMAALAPDVSWTEMAGFFPTPEPTTARRTFARTSTSDWEETGTTGRPTISSTSARATR
jgi:ketosteroid isomerase-like protein